MAEEADEAPEGTIVGAGSRVQRLATWAETVVSSPLPEAVNVALILFFGLAYCLIESGIAEENQFDVTIKLVSPFALLLASADVMFNVIALLSKATLDQAMKRYFSRWWNALDLVVVMIMWVQLFSEGNDEWYYILGLRLFRLAAVFRSASKMRRQQARRLSARRAARERSRLHPEQQGVMEGDSDVNIRRVS